MPMCDGSIRVRTSSSFSIATTVTSRRLGSLQQILHLQRGAITLDGNCNKYKTILGSKNQINGPGQQRRWFHSNASHGSRQLLLVGRPQDLVLYHGKAMVSYSSSNISINDGHSRRGVHSHTQQKHQQKQHEQFVSRVHTTYSQVERNKKIMSYGKAQQWQRSRCSGATTPCCVRYCVRPRIESMKR
jgi:hypothetical protein